MLGPEDLVLCAGTLAGASFRERVEAAAEGGFSAISLFLGDYQQARAQGLDAPEMRKLLTDHGVAVAELDPLMSWLPGAELGASANDQGAEFFRQREEDFYAAADVLGARSLNAICLTDAPLPTSAVAEAFAALCDRAAAHGLLVHLEFLPWTSIPDLDAALEIVELADRPNGGLMFDTWHHFRGPGKNERIRSVPGGRILALQINDAPREAEENLVDETLHRRLLPGEGDIDLVEILTFLDEVDSPAPVGVEVFSDALAGLPVRETARRAGDAARAVLRRARRG